ncbi:uncharacterized protein LOC142174124 [Nicotiana tabacum]|uniref:Uncharacterized protein LOC142174124 n=1 Tax=Nicotiana tabacum TaxID=4097 RepID=A0AC58TFF1_TOBAC
MPSQSLNMESPFFKLFNHHPDYGSLRIFGYRCFPYLRDYGKNKFSKKTYPCIFLGYSPIHKGYRSLDPSTNRIYLSRHVVFDETIFPCAPNKESISQENLEVTTFSDTDSWIQKGTNKSQKESSNKKINDLHMEKDDDHIVLDDITTIDDAYITPDIPPDNNKDHSQAENIKVSPTNDTENNNTNSINVNDLPDSSNSLTIDLNSSSTGSSLDATQTNRHHMITRQKLDTHPDLDPILAESIQQHQEKRIHKALTTTTTASVPKSVKTALTIPHWRESMLEDLQALHTNQTWTIVSRPSNANIIRSK